jgi:EAL domain-containing protein (putative c-di-GMP-specific phosphodiesterase class I)
VSNVNTNNYGDRARLDRWLLNAALDWLQRHKPTLQITRFLCVNLHAESINDAESIAETLDILRQHESVTSHLCLQISETTAQVSLKNLQHFLLLTQNMGAKVVLNDFGSGYNSLYFLKNLSADALRIDGHLIENMTENPKNMSIVEGIIQLARNLGMTSIATRVNDIRTLRLLIDLGVDYVQGSAIARPQQPDTVVDASSAGPFIEEAALATFAQAIADSDEQLMTSTPTFYKGNLH